MSKPEGIAFANRTGSSPAEGDHPSEPVLAPDCEHVPAAQRDWKKLAPPGVTAVLLREHAGERTLLVHLAPGATFPRHRHPGGETLYVLEGSVEIEGRTLGTGDYLYSAPGAEHAVTASARGCLLFILAPRPIELIDDATARRETAPPPAPPSAPAPENGDRRAAPAAPPGDLSKAR